MGARERFLEAVAKAQLIRDTQPEKMPAMKKFDDRVRHTERLSAWAKAQGVHVQETEKHLRLAREHQAEMLKIQTELRDIQASDSIMSEMPFRAAAVTRRGVTIRIPTEQLLAFDRVPLDPDADHATHLCAPFPDMFIVPSQPFADRWLLARDDEPPMIHAVIIEELSGQRLGAEIVDELAGHRYGWMADDFCWHEQSRVWIVYAHTPNLWEGAVMATLFSVRKDGTLYLSPSSSSALTGKDVDVTAPIRSTFGAWAAHLLYYLTSPSVVIAKKSPDAKLVKASVKRGKAPPQSWYEIEYKRTRHDVPTAEDEAETTGRHVSYRFDVRGHFATFKSGKLTGRTIWRRAHQRGLRNQLYVPKGYKVRDGGGTGSAAAMT